MIELIKILPVWLFWRWENFLFYTNMKKERGGHMHKIPFSPPDISELEIAEVAEAMRSGWITTGQE